MHPQREERNIGVRNGAWGETLAANFLAAAGYEVLERNARPCAHDRRLEIDIVAFDQTSSTLVFVEVKQHARRSERQCGLRSITRRKKTLLRRACWAWLRARDWRKSYRFDVIEIYGSPESGQKAQIDHFERVRLFVAGERFVDWKN